MSYASSAKKKTPAIREDTRLLDAWQPTFSSIPCHPSVPPDTPKGRDRGEELEQSPNAAQAALEERGQAAGELSRASLDGFFSAGSGWTGGSHMPADTAPCSASAMTNRSRAKRSAWRIWLSSRPNPLDLKSQNIASMPQRKP